jgi:putative FmdB family regulatory protein
MPIYEYSCKKCGQVIEKIQKFSDPPLKRHSECGGSLTKLVSQSSFHLKGSGWYVTDYAGKGSKADSEGTDGKEVAAKPESKKETEAKVAVDGPRSGKDSGSKKAPKTSSGSGTEK